ncbi:hypothetical protein SPRG_17733, partial [Saprolegnia parasitica CBS 223.65]
HQANDNSSAQISSSPRTLECLSRAKLAREIAEESGSRRARARRALQMASRCVRRLGMRSDCIFSRDKNDALPAKPLIDTTDKVRTPFRRRRVLQNVPTSASRPGVMLHYELGILKQYDLVGPSSRTASSHTYIHRGQRDPRWISLPRRRANT